MSPPVPGGAGLVLVATFRTLAPDPAGDGQPVTLEVVADVVSRRAGLLLLWVGGVQIVLVGVAPGHPLRT